MKSSSGPRFAVWSINFEFVGSQKFCIEVSEYHCEGILGLDMGILVIKISVSDVVRDGDKTLSEFFELWALEGETDTEDLEAAVPFVFIVVELELEERGLLDLKIESVFVLFSRLTPGVEALRIQEAGSKLETEVVVEFEAVFCSRLNIWDLLPLILGVSLLEHDDITAGFVASLALLIPDPLLFSIPVM